MGELLPHLVRATEAAARAVGPLVGGGDKLAVDRAATAALRQALNEIPFAARVAIGEGKKDRAPGLFAGEWVGRGRGVPSSKFQSSKEVGQDWYDLAVDPVDGTGQAAAGGRDSLAAVAVAGGGCLFATDHYYMRRVIAGPAVAARLNKHGGWLQLPTADLVGEAARALGKPVGDVTACVLDRPRHRDLIAALRAAGCRLMPADCDVSAAVAAGLPGAGVDLCLGVGGAPETVLSAAALRCLGGDLRAVVLDGDGNPADGRVLTAEDLARGPTAFAATGVTAGVLLRGVAGGRTHSIALGSSPPTIRWFE